MLRPSSVIGFGSACGFLLAAALPLSAAIIGTNPPAFPLTAARVAALPTSQQPAWNNYLRRSDKQASADRAAFAAGLRQTNGHSPTVPLSAHSVATIPLDRDADWYGGEEGRRIADIIVSFQTPAGGWSKNLNLREERRTPGEYYSPNNESHFLEPGDFDADPDPDWNYVGTFDNDATTTELRFLAKVIDAAPRASAPYRQSFLHGLDYIFAAQYPNGGWPQVWPLQGGYHDAITFNDDAVLNVLTLLRDVSGTNRDFNFVPRPYRVRARASLQRGIACVLDCQIALDGRRTVWCQQHDPLTLEPASARNYEMPSECSSESADLMMFLMDQPAPDRRMIAGIDAAARWFEKVQLRDLSYVRDETGRRLAPTPGAGPLWARYYQIGTDRPIFGDRDKAIHDRLDEISRERRNGYRWYNDAPRRALAEYAVWKKAHGNKN